jgi:nucleoside-diphosphate-sugar epimerase
VPPRLILVTGAAGFIGRHLCRDLAAAGYQVRGTVRANPPPFRQDIEYRASGDIGGAVDWSPLLADVDAVVHCAARVHVLREADTDPWTAFRRANVEATERLARQAAEAGVRRFVFLSSIKASVAERAGGAPPYVQPYDRSKLEAERALTRVARETGLEIVILRPPLVYGPGAGANFALLAKAVAKGWPLPLASIRNSRSFIYVGNLCGAIRTCLEHPAAPGGVFEVSDGLPVSTPDFARAVGAAISRPAWLLPCPPGLLRLIGRLAGRPVAAESLTGNLAADDRPIRERLGWRPRLDMAAALRETLAARRAAA